MHLGELIGDLAWPGMVIAFRGGLGVGKTTMIKGIARGLAIDDVITSPTYTIVSEYHGRLTMTHIDAYRLYETEDFEDTGGRDLFEPDGICVIEWSEKISSGLPSDAAIIELSMEKEGNRIITIHDEKLERMLP